MHPLKSVRRMGVTLLIAALSAAPMVSYAKLGGSGHAAPSVSRSAAVSAPSARLGGRQSIGMSRPDVVAKVRAQDAANAHASQPRNVAGAPAYVPAAPAAAQRAPEPRAQRSGPGWETVAGAAVAGAAAGYMLGNHDASSAQGHPSSVQGAPAASQQAAAAQALGQYDTASDRSIERSATQAGLAVEAPQDKGIGRGLGVVLVLLLLATGAYFVVTRSRAGTASTGAPGMQKAASYNGSGTSSGGAAPGRLAGTEDLQAVALEAFGNLQDANNRGDLAFLRAHTTSGMFEALKNIIDQRAGRMEQTSIVTMQAAVVDRIENEDQSITISIHFNGTISENPDAPPEGLSELWHFVDSGHGDWKLAGIDQV